MVFKLVLRNVIAFIAPMRRFGASPLARTSVLILGLAALTAYTVPDLQRAAGGWLTACLWSCLGYFAIDGATRANTEIGTGKVLAHIFSVSGLIDLIAVVAVPIALVSGVPPSTAWLLASLWILKLAQDSPGFAQLQRVFVDALHGRDSRYLEWLDVVKVPSKAGADASGRLPGGEPGG